eukprot:2131344-Amphidinium_carterae.1
MTRRSLMQCSISWAGAVSVPIAPIFTKVLKRTKTGRTFGSPKFSNPPKPQNNKRGQNKGDLGASERSTKATALWASESEASWCFSVVFGCFLPIRTDGSRLSQHWQL